MKGEEKVAFCPTTNVLADFCTKPLQGTVFKRMRKTILNLPPGTEKLLTCRRVIDREKFK